MQVILGSSSKWRRDIAKQCLGGEILLISPDIDERAVARSVVDPNPTSHCSTIARAKLDFVLQKVTTPSIILCFDTIVLHSNKILEKPADEIEAVGMVRKWGKKGEEIEVLTAIACAVSSPLQIAEKIETAKIILNRDLTENEIEKYFEDRTCLDSSGTLVVEHLLEYGAVNIEGERSVIEGFPISSVKKFVDSFKS
jgi:septum formation protein